VPCTHRRTDRTTCPALSSQNSPGSLGDSHPRSEDPGT
jgi:hypothetical protein